MGKTITCVLLCYLALALIAVASQRWNAPPSTLSISQLAISKSDPTVGDSAKLQLSSANIKTDAQQVTGRVEIAPLSTRFASARELELRSSEEPKPEVGQLTNGSMFAWKVNIDEKPALEPPIPTPGAWGVFAVWACAFIGFLLTSTLGKRPSMRWAFVFVFCTLLTLWPHEFSRAVGMLAAIAVAIGWLHFTYFKYVHSQGVLLGAVLAVAAYVFAFAGVLATHRELNFAEQTSAAMYEAAQVLFLNMGVHDELNVPFAARWYFGLARALASTLALFVAYKTVLVFSARAGTRIRLNFDQLKFLKRKPLQLVVGVGKVGRQLAQNLAIRGDRVISIENNANATCWKNPPVGKVRLIEADASHTDTFAQLPFDAIENIFVTAGEDQRNLEIGQVVKEYVTKRASEVDELSKSMDWRNIVLHWWNRSFFVSRPKDRPANCLVQLYDGNMRRILDQTLHGLKSNALAIVRPFNAQEMAVRDLIQFELASEELRPKFDRKVGDSIEKEVALYIIVGFDSLGQELALGLAQLAHFDNLLRSRILILSREPQQEIAGFCARYPKFAKSSKITELGEIEFDSADDEWDANRHRELDECRNSCGVDFAVNAKFAKLPASASDRALLEAIKSSTKETQADNETLRVKPILFVCDDDWQRGFAWASEIAESWKQLLLREKLKSNTEASNSVPPSMRTYFWLQGHKAIPRLLENQHDVEPFGISDDLLTESSIAGTVWRQVGAAAQRSYELTNPNPDKPVDKTTQLNLLSYSDTQSNLLAAAHSIIKYRIAGRSIKWIHDYTVKKLPPIAVDPVLHFRSHQFTLPTDPDHINDPLIERIAIAEHNRWMAEQLLAGREWIVREPNKDANGKKLRDRHPEERHLRDTLCAWRYLKPDEKLKDLLQTYYVLYYLDRLER